MTNLQLVFPEIFLSLSIMFLLILGVFKKNSSKIIQNLSLAVLLITAVITFNETISIKELYKISPLGSLSSFFTGIIHAAFFSLISVYATLAKFSLVETSILLFLSLIHI